MGLSQRIVQKQTQKLVITQDLRQSIELLQLSTVELLEKIQSELMENPMLEEDNNFEKQKTPELYSISEERLIEKNSSIKSTDTSWQDVYSIDKPSYVDSEASDRNQKMIESSPVGETLANHLLFQLHILNLTDEETEVGEILISMIDDRGFISASVEEISNELNLKKSIIQKVLEQIQEMEPVGLGAKDIKDTIRIQAKILYPEDFFLHKLIIENFEDLEKFDYKKISRNLKITEKEVEELSKIIKKLEPYPATKYSSKKIEYIVPDIIIQEIDGEFVIQLNDEWLPKLKVNDSYKKIVNSHTLLTDKEYINVKINAAQWLIRSINQRRQTLFKVINSILDFQIEFFKGGIRFLKPLTLKDIAEKLSMHESTISRVTTNKYVQTNWGVFELKWFFSSSVKSTEGQMESSKKIHDIIKNLVKEESQMNPLSDQEIVEIMNSKGIGIARRTVAKYRKILKILPSNRRKKNEGR
ncbi:MAG: RNA polymerase factor sigma-54 [Leptospiraceae bacterium]|nr:RNA polymerase factor sigma-54 [Leptospiraceae bacterium]MCK6379810.1 RNA polymerase factor sigma-54 [Leptospiraceae bacterium]